MLLVQTYENPKYLQVVPSSSGNVTCNTYSFAGKFWIAPDTWALPCSEQSKIFYPTLYNDLKEVDGMN